MRHRDASWAILGLLGACLGCARPAEDRDRWAWLAVTEVGLVQVFHSGAIELFEFSTEPPTPREMLRNGITNGWCHHHVETPPWRYRFRLVVCPEATYILRSDTHEIEPILRGD